MENTNCSKPNGKKPLKYRPSLMLAALFSLGTSTAAPAEMHLNFYYTSGALNCDEPSKPAFSSSIGLHSPVITSDGSEYNAGIGTDEHFGTHGCEDLDVSYREMTEEEQKRFKNERISITSVFLRREVKNSWQEAAIGSGFTRMLNSRPTLGDHGKNHLWQFRYFYGYRFMPQEITKDVWESSVFTGLLYQKFRKRQCVLDSECAETQLLPTNTQRIFLLLGFNFGFWL